MKAEDFGPHPFECLPNSDDCSICGRRSVDRRGDVHMFSDDLGEVSRSRSEIKVRRSKFRVRDSEL